MKNLALKIITVTFCILGININAQVRLFKDIAKTVTQSDNVINISNYQNNLFFEASSSDINGNYYYTLNLTTKQFFAIVNISGEKITGPTEPDFHLKDYPQLGGVGYNGKFYFSGTTNATGSEFLEYDPITQKAKLIKDINIGKKSSFPRCFTVFKDSIYFIAEDSIQGAQLWISDGTSLGTRRITNKIAGQAGTVSSQLTNLGDQLFFVQDDTKLKLRLYKSTSSNKISIQKDTISNLPFYYYGGNLTLGNSFLFENIDNINGSFLNEYKNGKYFRISRYFQEKKCDRPLSGFELNGKKFIVYESDSFGCELFELDTSHKMRILADLNPGIGSSNVILLGKLKSQFVFSAVDTTGLRRIYITDGTRKGTSKITSNYFDSSFNTYSINFQTMSNENDFILFNAYTKKYGIEIWQTDGTPYGTKLFKDIYPGIYDGNLSSFNFINNNFYFVGTNKIYSGNLWKIDGNTKNLSLLTDINLNNTSSNISIGAELNNYYIFGAKSDSFGHEPWISDGTSNGTKMLKDINKASAIEGFSNKSADVYGFTKYNNKIYFSATDSLHGNELWETDGTTTNTKIVTDFVAGTTGFTPTYLYSFKNKLLITGYHPSYGFELFEFNGTSIKILKDFNSGSSSSRISYLYKLNDSVIIIPVFIGSKFDIWKYDGSAFTLLKSMSSRNCYLSDNRIVKYDGKLFIRYANSTVHEIIMTDGTASGTNLFNGNLGSKFSDVGAILDTISDKLLFLSRNCNRSFDLYAYDSKSNSSALLSYGKDTSNIIYSGYTPIIANKKLLFFFEHDTFGSEPFASDGSKNGTYLIKDINKKNKKSLRTGSDASSDCLISLGNYAIFAAYDSLTGEELYISNLDSGQVSIFHEFIPGPAGISPGLHFWFKNKLFISAIDVIHKRELFTLGECKTPSKLVTISGTNICQGKDSVRIKINSAEENIGYLPIINSIPTKTPVFFNTNGNYNFTLPTNLLKNGTNIISLGMASLCDTLLLPDTALIKLNIKPSTPSILGNSFGYLNDTNKYVSSVTGKYKYNWTANIGSILGKKDSSTINVVLKSTPKVSLQLTISDQNNCLSDTAILNVGTSVANLTRSSLNKYFKLKNHDKRAWEISFNENYFNTIREIRFYSIDGKLLYAKDKFEVSKNLLLNATQFPTGYVVLLIYTKDQSISNLIPNF